MSAIVLERAISADVVAKLRAAIAVGPFVPGRETAVGGAALLKDNLQLAFESPAAEPAAEMLLAALQENPAFQAATWADASLRPLFCRYEPGMKYGNHIDGAILGEPPMQIRCDIAVTVCLNDGSSYEGGELVIDSAGAAHAWKGRAGDAIVYAADTLHRVAEVKKGTREVAVFWIQSLIRDAGRRRILYDLKSALEVLDQSPTPPPHVDAIRRSYFNLIRMWV